MEYNPSAEEVSPIATWFLLTESERRPAVFLGTSTDRIGTPSGQAVYATAAKSLGNWSAAPYVTLYYSGWEEELKVPFGVHVDLIHGFSLRPMYDGERTHLTATYSSHRFSVTALYIWLEKPGLAASIGF